MKAKPQTEPVNNSSAAKLTITIEATNGTALADLVGNLIQRVESTRGKGHSVTLNMNPGLRLLCLPEPVLDGDRPR
jgi:hypothetical protein